jgi:hypothetical protein
LQAAANACKRFPPAYESIYTHTIAESSRQPDLPQLKTFIEIRTPGTTAQTVLWQVVVHLTFVSSALLLAWTDRISSVTAVETRAKDHEQLVGHKANGVDQEQAL